MKIIEIVAEHLRSNGFGGLVQCDAECGCKLDDLQPCGDNFASCEPAYKHMDPRRGHRDDWRMWKCEEPPTLEQWANVDDA